MCVAITVYSIFIRHLTQKNIWHKNANLFFFWTHEHKISLQAKKKKKLKLKQPLSYLNMGLPPLP